MRRAKQKTNVKTLETLELFEFTVPKVNKAILQNLIKNFQKNPYYQDLNFK